MKATVLIITALLLSTTLAQARYYNRYDNPAEPRYTTYDARRAGDALHHPDRLFDLRRLLAVNGRACRSPAYHQVVDPISPETGVNIYSRARLYDGAFYSSRAS
jgi:hypothetical protein